MRRLFLLSLLTLVLSVSIAAHHPFDATFDRNKPVTLTGTVTEFTWGNPHATLQLNGAAGSERPQAWKVELGNPSDLAKTGWSMKTLKVGDKVTVEGRRAKDGSAFVNAKSLKIGNAATLSAASSYYAPEEGAHPTSGEHTEAPRR